MNDDQETAESLDLAAEGVSADEIEAAYHRALEAVQAVEQAVPELCNQAVDEADFDSTSAETRATPVSGINELSAPSTGDASFEPLLRQEDREHVLQPEQVVEAVLFVGGEPLTAKRLVKLLGESTQSDTAEEIIRRLNERYTADARPYEVKLEEGGYRLTLRPEFERVRDRVYGRSPKEVKLSQEALEVLAFVAYRQPSRCQDIVDAGKKNAAGMLRQLLRRELVSLQRDDGGEVSYVTTPRFLEVFGLRNLDELPLPDDLALK